MKNNRRNFLSYSSIGVFGLLPLQYTFDRDHRSLILSNSVEPENGINPLYPTTNPEDVRDVVGAAHTQFDRVKELVSARPELAKATWDWGFGDVESALGAASHMGRKDIAEFLIEHGARPNIFTFAMLGKLNSVKTMVEEMPGIEKLKGPHGFTLAFHAQMRLRRNNVEGAEKEEQEALVEYLKTLEGSDVRDPALEISEEEQKTYLGKYSFGKGKDEYFDISLNSRGLLYMSRGEYTGRVLNRVDTHSFAPGGAPSVKIHFEVSGSAAQNLVIHDPGPVLRAERV